MMNMLNTKNSLKSVFNLKGLVVLSFLLSNFLGATSVFAGNDTAHLKVFVVEASAEGKKKIDPKLRSLASDFERMRYKNIKVIKSKKVKLKKGKLKEFRFKFAGKTHTLKLKLKDKASKKIKFRIQDKKMGISTTIKMKVGKMVMIKGRKKGKRTPFLIFKAVK